MWSSRQVWNWIGRGRDFTGIFHCLTAQNWPRVTTDYTHLHASQLHKVRARIQGRDIECGYAA